MGVAGTIQMPELDDIPDGEGTNWQLACTDAGFVAVAPDGTAQGLTAPGCAFLAYNSAADSNVTGDGTWFTVDFDTEVFDVGGDFASGTFTAPETGKYMLGASVLVTGIANNMGYGFLDTITSNRHYYGERISPDAIENPDRQIGLVHSALVDMDIGDTAYMGLMINGGTKVAGVYGGANTYTFFWGYRVA